MLGIAIAIAGVVLTPLFLFGIFAIEKEATHGKNYLQPESLEN